MPFTADARAQVQVGVREVVNRWDPERLLALEAPADEYEPEVRSFGSLLAQDVTITPDIVTQVWEEWFGPGSDFVRRASHAGLAKFADELNQVAATAKKSAQV